MEKIQHHKKLRRKLLIKLSALWLVLIILGSVSIGILFQYALQNVSVIQNMLAEKTEQQVISEQPLQLTKIRSDKLGYELTFNPQIFKPDRATNTTQKDLSEIGLITEDTAQIGFGQILFSAYSEAELADIVDDPTLGKEKLERAANWYQRKKIRDLTDTSIFVSKEKITKWGTDSYRLTYKRQIFGKDVFHYIYVVIKNNKLYTVLADYPKLDASQKLIESWIDEISFIGPNTAEVQAETIAKKLDLNEVKLVELNKPSVVQIISINCVTIKLKDTSKVRMLRPQYELCTGGTGSGFMISKDGLVATNGHVAKVSFEDLIVSGKPEPGSTNFYADFYQELSQNQSKATDSAQLSTNNNVDKNPSTIDALLQKYTDYENQGIFDKAQFLDRYFVKLGNDPIKFAKPSAINPNALSYKTLQPIERTPTIMDAELVASDFAGVTAFSQAAIQALQNNNKKPQKTSDVALIKLKVNEKMEFPGVPMISSKEVKEGQQILVMGFPGLVSGQDPKAGFLLDEAVSSVRPTITRGIISAIKQDTFGQTLLQTDASIEHGNSGGPAFSYLGDVLGIATYVISSGSGNYNFLRATDDLFTLMQKNNLPQNQESAVYTNWKDGLTYFWEGRFTKAKEQFNKVKELYPIHPQVNEYIQTADQGIKDGQDIDLNGGVELKSFGYTQQQITLFIAIIMTVLIIVGGIITTYFIYDHKQKMNVILAVQQPVQTAESRNSINTKES